MVLNYNGYYVLLLKRRNSVNFLPNFNCNPHHEKVDMMHESFMPGIYYLENALALYRP